MTFMTPMQMEALRTELLELADTVIVAQVHFATVAEERRHLLPELATASAFVQLAEDDDAARPVLILTVGIAYAAYQDLPALRKAKRSGMRPLKGGHPCPTNNPSSS